MRVFKHVLFLCGALLCAPMGAQENGDGVRRELSIEEQYLSSVEDVVISELAAADDYDSKAVALQYLEEAVDAGRLSEEKTAALIRLAEEGVVTQSRMNGRLINNFPDLRAKACNILGKVQTEEAKNTLMAIVSDEKEPMVAGAAVRSLGDIGINDNDEVLNLIYAVHRKFSVLNPASSFAMEVLNAYEKLSPSVQNKDALIEAVSEIETNYRYLAVVRSKATALRRDLEEAD